MTLAERPEWMLRAACRSMDPALFFPPSGAPTEEAPATCWRCPVREACLAYALDGGERFGVWGGVSAEGRRKLRRRMARGRL